MSTATATEVPEAPPKTGLKGKKKLLIMIGAAVLVLGLAGGGGAAFYLKKKHAAEAEAEAAAAADDTAAAHGAKAVVKRDPKSVPTFVPLDPFTVNLADREAERYAQVGISLELADAKTADRVKVFMPVIRNNILMVLAHKTSAELLERDGKATLAREILQETARALGVEPQDEAPPPKPAADGADKAKAKPHKEADEPPPVIAVHFSNFIIQ